MVRALVGDLVYVYSMKSQEVISGVVEGFSEESEHRVKVLQKIGEGYVRHLVSSAYLFYNEEEALNFAQEERSLHDDTQRLLREGMTVLLRSRDDDLVRDNEGNALLYQIVSISEDFVSLVTSYGELIGKYEKSSVVYHSEESIFSAASYEIGQKVQWISKDSVYEGTIRDLRKKTAEIVDIKELYPVDEKRFIPYYKLTSGDLQEPPKMRVLSTKIGDDLED